MEISMKTSILSVAALSVVFLAGCSKASSGPETAATLPVKKSSVVVDAAAGVPITQSTDAKRFTALVASNSGRFGAGRPDPFALTREDQAYDVQQGTERLFQQSNFSMEYQPPVEADPTPPTMEPQPYRRLSGIVVGDSVLAIMDMGAGGDPVIIRPGMKIPNSEWTVVSIDSEKAVLSRPGNVRPNRITVRLESPPPGMGGTPNGGLPGGAGRPGNSGGPVGFAGAGSGGGGGGAAGGGSD
jgi:hypothetical protein